MVHAFFGPDLAPKNLATLLTWVHFRGLVVVLTLIGGNLFCMACPFMLPREIARRLFVPRLEWPRALRNKWPAIVLFVVVLFCYELFDLWGDPWWTGALILVYFLAALIVDITFKKATFCKFVCPIGQFNFLASELSPWEVSVRNKDVCERCTTKDCIKGRTLQQDIPVIKVNALPIVQRGCELALFQPRKVGNLDCTFCLDCVYACPHENVGILSRVPVESLTREGSRSGLGDIQKRFDFTALVTVFTFGSLLNAFAMISPVYALEQFIAAQTGLRIEWPILGAMFLVALVLEPFLLLATAAALSRRFLNNRGSILEIINAFAKSLIPIGFGIWLAHYGFHFFTGFLTVIPVTQNAVRELVGWSMLGEPIWRLGGLPEAVVFPMELGFMGLGLLGSILATLAIAREHSLKNARLAAAPWICLDLILFASAVWIMTQPMDMRGTFLGG